MGRRSLKRKVVEEVERNYHDLDTSHDASLTMNDYCCAICQKDFHNKSTLDKHARVHTGEKPFECDECGKRFTTKPSMRVHILRQHCGEKAFKCDICEKRYTGKQALRAHILRHTGEKPFKCDICGLPLGGRQALKDHKMRHTGEKPFECDICGVRFRQKPTMISHKLRHTGERPFKCDICGIAYRTREGLRTHKPKHGEKQFECDICKSLFYLKPEMEKHKALMHNREYRVKCCYCSRDFYTRQMMLVHSLERHFEGLQCFTCPIANCGEVTTKYSTVQTHLDESHLIDLKNPVCCKQCEKTFTESRYFLFHFYADHAQEQVIKANRKRMEGATETSDDDSSTGRNLGLRRAMPSGSEKDVASSETPETSERNGKKYDNETRNQRPQDEKKLKCDQCDKQFALKKELQLHQWRHNREKPFKCDKCASCFATLARLRRHKLIHKKKSVSASKQCICEVCGKRLATSCNLKNHMRLHTGAKPFACDICGKGFAQAGNVKVHMLLHTGERPYTCAICEKGFTNKIDLAKHKRLHDVAEEALQTGNCVQQLESKPGTEGHDIIFDDAKHSACGGSEKRLGYESAVEEHEYVSSGEGPNMAGQRLCRCSYCGDRFECRGKMVEHAMKHVNCLDCFCCPVAKCSEEFEKHIDVYLHLEEEHIIELDSPEGCKQCGKMFTQAQELLNHFYADHPPEQIVDGTRLSRKPRSDTSNELESVEPPAASHHSSQAEQIPCLGSKEISNFETDHSIQSQCCSDSSTFNSSDFGSSSSKRSCADDDRLREPPE